jgi:DNA-binding transcriptional LysR family regulator
VLSDENVDPLQDGLDVTLRIADLESSSLIARKIMPIARVICASPDYFGAHGVQHPNDLRDHNCLTYGFSPPAISGSCRARTAITGSSLPGRCARIMPKCYVMPRSPGAASRSHGSTDCPARHEQPGRL